MQKDEIIHEGRIKYIVSLHPVISELIWREEKPNLEDELLAQYTGSLIGIINDDTKSPKEKSEYLDIVTFFAKRINEETELAAATYDGLSSYLQEQGIYYKMLEYELIALEIRKKILPKDHPHLALSYSNVGVSYGNLGQYEEALEHHLIALEMRKEILPSDHPDIADSYYNVKSAYKKLIETYTNQGRHEEAEELAQKLIALEDNS